MRAHESLLAQRIYDLIRYEDLAYAEDYVARLLRVHAQDSAAHGYAATAGRALESASRHGDQGRGLCRLPPQQRGEIRARPRALQRPPRTRRPDDPSPSQPTRVHLRQAHPPLQAEDAALDAAAHAPRQIPAPSPPRLARAGNAPSAPGISISPTSSPRLPIPPPTRRGSRSCACPRKPPAIAKSAIPEWQLAQKRAEELLGSLASQSKTAGRSLS